MNNPTTQVFLGLVLAMECLVSACGGLATLSGDLEELDTLAKVRGNVEVEDWSGAPLLVAILAASPREGAPDSLQDFSILDEPGGYEFYVPPGRYRVVAFEDANRNLDYEETERVDGYLRFSEFSIEAGQVRQNVDLRVSETAVREDQRIVDATEYSRKRVLGRVTRLDDPRLGPESGPLGLWSPVEFVERYGVGVHFTEEMDPSRVPVLFVHGISGHPQEFETLIAGLDQSKFQAWVFHYPSGLSLDWMSEHLARDIGDLARTHHVERMCIVAHSMGGVLMRLMLKEHAGVWPSALAMPRVVTISSPLRGMGSAGMGVRMSPVVVPSWTSLDPEGETILGLYGSPLPSGTEYALFFAHEGTDGTDGVVPLSSQLRGEAMAEATEVWGFTASHTSVLRLPAASERLNRVLAPCALPEAPEPATPQAAP